MKKTGIKKQQTISAECDVKDTNNKRAFANKGTSSKVQTQLPLTPKTVSVVSPPEKVGQKVPGPTKNCLPEAISTPTDTVSESESAVYEHNSATVPAKPLAPTAVESDGAGGKLTDHTDVPVEFQSSTMRALLDKYSIGRHMVDRSRLHIGPNTRVVTMEGILKIVESLKAHGHLKDGNVPIVSFNTPDVRFANLDIVRKSPELLQEIVEMGTMMYHAGAHREMAWQFLDKNPQHTPEGLEIPSALEVEVLVNVNDSFDTFLIGKKHNKITQAQNDEKIVDYIKQVETIWKQAQQLGGIRKKITQADAYRLNVASFGAEDMKSTKFNVYFNISTTLTRAFLLKLETYTVETGADIMPFNALEVLVKFVKGKDMKEKPTLSVWIQLESVEIFHRYFKLYNKQLNSKVFETILLPYFTLMFSFKITALGLLPPPSESMDMEATPKLPAQLEEFFNLHVHKAQLTDSGLAAMQEFYTTHLPYFTENFGYLPPEIRSYFTAKRNDELSAATAAKRNQCFDEEAGQPILPEGTFCAAKKQKRNENEVKNSEPVASERRTSNRIATKQQTLILGDNKVCDDDMPQSQDTELTDTDTSRLGGNDEGEQSEEDQRLDQPFQESDTTGVSALELYTHTWTVPTKQEYDQAQTVWVSGPSANQPDYTQSQQYIQHTKTWAALHPTRCSHEHCPNFPEQASFIVMDCRGQQIISKDEVVLEELEFFSEHLMNMGVLLIVADFPELMRYLNVIEAGQAMTLKLRPDGSFIHYYLYNVSGDARTKTQACPLCMQTYPQFGFWQNILPPPLFSRI